MNQSLLAIAAAAEAAGIAIGKIAIEIGKKRFELQKAMAENPVSYITYAKEKLGEGENSTASNRLSDHPRPAHSQELYKTA